MEGWIGPAQKVSGAPASLMYRMLMRAARDHLHKAGTKNAADYVRRALKSVEGAERHALRMEFTERERSKGVAA